MMGSALGVVLRGCCEVEEEMTLELMSVSLGDKGRLVLLHRTLIYHFLERVSVHGVPL